VAGKLYPFNIGGRRRRGECNMLESVYPGPMPRSMMKRAFLPVPVSLLQLYAGGSGASTTLAVAMALKKPRRCK